MNSLSDSVKNYLITPDSTDYLPQLFKLCLEKVKKGQLVLIITSELYDFTGLLNQLNIDKDQLKNFIIMYYKTIDEISRKLLLLHSWSLLPSLVVVDLFHLLSKETTHTSVSLMQKITLCTVSLLTYLQSAVEQKARRLYNDNVPPEINGLLILSSGVENFGVTQIQTLKDFYFYKTELYEDFQEVKTKLMPLEIEEDKEE